MKEIDSRVQRIGRGVRAKIYSGSLDVKMYNPSLQELKKDQKTAVENAIQGEKLRQQLDPAVNRKNSQNGYILEKELFTPGPATYSPDKNAVYGKSKGYRYREPLRERILAKTDLLEKRKIREQLQQEKERLRQANRSSRSRAESAYSSANNNSELHNLTRKSQSTKNKSQRNSRVQKKDSDSEKFSDDSVHELDNLSKNNPSQQQGSVVPSNPKLDEGNPEQPQRVLALPIQPDQTQPRKSILNRRPSSFTPHGDQSSQSFLQHMQALQNKTRKSVYIALPGANLADLVGHNTQGAESKQNRSKRESVMSKLNEQNASSEDSQSSRSDSPLTLEKLKKQQETNAGRIRNPDYKGQAQAEEQQKTKAVTKKNPKKPEQRRPSSILNRRHSILSSFRNKDAIAEPKNVSISQLPVNKQSETFISDGQSQRSQNVIPRNILKTKVTEPKQPETKQSDKTTENREVVKKLETLSPSASKKSKSKKKLVTTFGTSIK